jgi:hypothetical protein
MAKCAACGTTILLGGKRQGDLRFCNHSCLTKGAIVAAMQSVPESLVTPRAWEIHSGRCPVCHGSGPVDIHNSFRVWSGLIMTSYQTRQNLCCRSCATRARLKDAGFSLLFGWWGIPWGLIWTPVQIVRNVAAIMRSEDAPTPSPALVHLVRLQLAAASAPATYQSSLAPR